MNKLLRVCVAVGLVVGLFLCVGCGDDKGVGPGGETNTNGATGGGVDDPRPPVFAAEWKLLKDGSSDRSLAGTTWLWEAVTRMLFAGPSAHGDKAYTLEFKEDGTIVTYSYVNQFWGTYTAESRGGDEIYKINIENFGGTKAGDINDSDELWRISFRAVNSFSLKGDVLTLFYNDGRDSLVYIPQGGTPSVGADPLPNALAVSYKKYSLEESRCEWKEERFAAKNGTVVVINNNEALENYVGCIDGTYPAVDFSKQTLLVATGLEAYQNTPYIGTLVKNPDGTYLMEVNLNMSLAAVITFWQVPVVIDKIDDNSRVSLIVMRNMGGDPIMNDCYGGNGLFKKNCGADGSGLRSNGGDTVTVVSGR